MQPGLRTTGKGSLSLSEPRRGISFSLHPWPLLGTHTHSHTYVCTTARTHPRPTAPPPDFLRKDLLTRIRTDFSPTLKLPMVPSCFHNKSQTPFSGIQAPSSFPIHPCHFCPRLQPHWPPVLPSTPALSHQGPLPPFPTSSCSLLVTPYNACLHVTLSTAPGGDGGGRVPLYTGGDRGSERV